MDIVEPVLKSVESTGGGWPVLVLLVVIFALVYIGVRWTDRQARMADERVTEQAQLTEQRVRDRKAEFEAQLERERNNAISYRATTDRMVDAFNQNSAAMAEFTGVLRPMAETLDRIDRHFGESDFQSRRKGTND